MRILVTGGTGFVGCHTVAALLAAGHEVRLLVRAPARVAPALEPVGIDPGGMEAVVGDITDAAAVREAADGCDAVVHIAAVWSLDPRRAREIERVNAPGAETVLRAAAEAGLDPIVHVSSYSALLPRRPGAPPLDGDAPVGSPPTPYAASKAAAEAVARALQAEGAPVAITYPGMIWGPQDPHVGETSRVALDVLRGRLPALPPGVLPMSDVRDVADVHAALAVPGRGPRRYFVSSANMRVADAMRAVVRLAGRRLPVVTVPAPVARASGLAGDVLGRLGIGLLPSREAVWIASQDGAADASATARDLGIAFRPADESIADTVRWLHEAGHLSARAAGALAQPA
jgi:nucleoside-diphosphate-sugar epimerase